MEYQYKCRITAWDFFRLTMRQTYRSMAGMCNLVFTVAMILLTAKFWSQSGEVLQVLMLIGCLLFPVIQPAAIYAKARRQAAAVPQDVAYLCEKGLLVTTGGERQHLPWNRLRVTKTAGDGAGAFGSRKRLYADQPCAGSRPGGVLVLCTEQSGTE